MSSESDWNYYDSWIKSPAYKKTLRTRKVVALLCRKVALQRNCMRRKRAMRRARLNVQKAAKTTSARG
ncbi:hypothetical protein EWM64_g3054 [Hericium alpestre]|uniref:Uncharacterized protein n=1 Tax=Hericium alpestre TaxID=135208 RepID=A0A4Z0A1K6_9AGAM|nr:hypothetical protein EWM64_g3054 [Hericium alpestre]